MRVGAGQGTHDHSDASDGVQLGHGDQHWWRELPGDGDDEESHGDVHDQGDLGGEHGLCGSIGNADDDGNAVVERPAGNRRQSANRQL